MKEIRDNILYEPEFLPNHRDLYPELLEEFFTQKPQFVAYGGPRLGSPSFRTSVTNSYTDLVGLRSKSLESMLWGPTTGMLAGMLARLTNVQPTVAVRNFYRDGSDYLQPHADYDVAIGPHVDDVVVATVSFGAPRALRMERIDGEDSFVTVLDPGSLFLMKGDVQRHWLHSIPASVPGSRLSITYFHHQLDPPEKCNWALCEANADVRKALEDAYLTRDINKLLKHFEGPILRPVLIAPKEEIFTAWHLREDWEQFIVSGSPVHGKDMYLDPKSWLVDFPELEEHIHQRSYVDFGKKQTGFPPLGMLSTDQLGELATALKEELEMRLHDD